MCNEVKRCRMIDLTQTVQEKLLESISREGIVLYEKI